jgi:hypothetical protein
MRRLWLVVTIGSALAGVVLLYSTLRDFGDLGLYDVITIALVILAYYWIAAGAWRRARRQAEEEVGGYGD